MMKIEVLTSMLQKRESFHPSLILTLCEQKNFTLNNLPKDIYVDKAHLLNGDSGWKIWNRYFIFQFHYLIVESEMFTIGNIQ